MIAFVRGRRAIRPRGQALVEFALVTPILLLLVLVIGDFARLYTSEIAVESAAREAADYGAFTPTQWDSTVPGQVQATVNQMVSRACVASSTLPDYSAKGDATTLCSVSGSNPTFSYQLEDSTGQPVSNPPADCSNPNRVPAPCVVHVTMTYTYHTFFSIPAIPILNFSPYPSTLNIQRDSRFAISDFQAPTSSASP